MEKDTSRRTCKICLQSLPLTTEFFLKNNNYKYGFHTRCHSCRNKMAREVYKKYKPKVENDVLYYHPDLVYM